MKWVIWLSVISILLTLVDGIVHVVEASTTVDVLRRLSPGASGLTDLRRTFGTQVIWTAASAWVVVSQLGIIGIAAKSLGAGKR